MVRCAEEAGRPPYLFVSRMRWFGWAPQESEINLDDAGFVDLPPLRRVPSPLKSAIAKSHFARRWFVPLLARSGDNQELPVLFRFVKLCDLSPITRRKRGGLAAILCVPRGNFMNVVIVLRSRVICSGFVTVMLVLVLV